MRRDIFLALLAAVHPAALPRTTLPETDCEKCMYRDPAWRDGGWCYMFRERVERCAQFKPVQITINQEPDRE